VNRRITLKIDSTITPASLKPKILKLWDISAPKILSIESSFPERSGAPVFTIDGKYAARSWTEWTRGFQYGSALLQFDATGDETFLNIGRDKTVRSMSRHVTHFGVHDHGFNIISTYGNLRRLMNENRIQENEWERHFYELALTSSGAVQAKRWTPLSDGKGYIYSFNGPHSLFADTIRSLRSLATAHALGCELHDEQDARVSLLKRLIHHAETTAKYNVYYGEKRDGYDVRGRVAHESIFNAANGVYRCPNSQQGYSPFSTWTRGLAWIMLGYAEQLEFIAALKDGELKELGGRKSIESMMLKAATATCDFYIENTPLDGVPYWDAGAPQLHKLGDYLNKKADPFNKWEPVDSSTAAIAAQGLLRLGHLLKERGDKKNGARYWQAGLTVLNTLFDEPYLCAKPSHQGLILHSVYHRPNGWDNVPKGQKIPNGESSLWGDYHAREAALYVQRILEEKYFKFL
jgi:unsaturated chondroitin disaccharide hydrolase